MQVVEKLIEQFKPNNYNLSLEIDRINRKIYGEIIISGTAVGDSDAIKLHSKDLTIESILIDEQACDFSFEENDVLKINLDTAADQVYTIKIKYNGEITDAMYGIYPCYYSHDQVQKELIATQFESHHAREVFPCIDEPAAKATFDVTLTTENNITVIGNMPIKKQFSEDDKLITTFETTPLMSSYLLALVTGELHKKTAYTKRGVEVNVWATPAHASDNLDFALEIATKSIDFFDEYFDTPYPLPKSDHVALPDFSAGAMENWGLITYREIALLVDPKNTSISTKQYVATVIAHELSHQWFGNLVTMQWWNDLWLNESFASLMEYVAVDAINPKWNVWLDFASHDSVIALRRDRLAGVQPVQIDVNHPDEISTLFDGAIVYAKGARLLQMLQRYIGEQAFQAGLKTYFKEFAYQNTKASDLWKHLSSASGKDIESFMQKWLSRPGFPVLHASLNGNQLTLTQEKLVSKSSQTDDTLWPISLNSNQNYLPEILDQKTITVKVNDASAIRFNVDNRAHFITHYDDKLLSRIIDQLKANELSIIDRLQLLNEQLLLAQAGVLSSSSLISIIMALKDETSEAVWSIISLIIGHLARLAEHDQELDVNLRKLAGELAESQYNRLGFSQIGAESENDTKLRQIIISLILYSENKAAIDVTREIFATTDIDDIDPELRSLVLSTVVKHYPDEQLINNLITKYQQTNSTELQQDIRAALTATKDSQIVAKLLNILQNKDIVRSQDVASWVVHLIRSKYGRNLAWRWIRDNWQWIEDTFSGDKSYDCFPRYVATALSTEKELKEFKEFYEPMLNVPALSRIIKVGINEISDRVDLINRDLEPVKLAVKDATSKS